jgi:copper chaperone CopZ
VALEGTEGVKKAEVDLDYATVWHDPAKVTVDQLISVIVNAGKDSVEVT